MSKVIDIEIGGKVRPFLFCLNSIAEFSSIENMSVMESLNNIDFNKLDLSQLFTLYYCAFKQGAKFQKQEIDFTKDDIGYWLDEDMAKIGEIMQAVTQQAPKAKNPEAPVKAGQQK